MKKILRRTLISLAAVVVIIAGVTLNFLVKGGAFRTHAVQNPGTCTTIPTNGPSAEDIQIDQGSGIAYLSTYDRRAQIAGKQVTGTISQIDLNGSTMDIVPALVAEPPDFRPHGISVFEDPSGKDYLFVISHLPNGGHTIEVFERTDEQARFLHAETIADPLFAHPNDLAAIGPRQFFVANDSGATNGVERAAEMLFGRGLSHVVYYDGATARTVDDNFSSASGINVDLNAQRLYVSETMGQRIRVLDLADENFPEIQRISLKGSPDNIDIDAAGNAWIATHSNTLKLIQHFGDANKLAPSHIWKISKGSSEATSEYFNEGEEISAGSVGAKWDDLLLIGSITEPKVVVCRLSADS